MGPQRIQGETDQVGENEATVVRRPPKVLGTQGLVILGAVAAAIDAYLLARSGASVGRIVVASIALGVFVAYGTRYLQRKSFERFVRETGEGRASSDAPPAGSWANPTRSQKARVRGSRIGESLLPRGKRPRR